MSTRFITGERRGETYSTVYTSHPTGSTGRRNARTLIMSEPCARPAASSGRAQAGETRAFASSVFIVVRLGLAGRRRSWRSTGSSGHTCDSLPVHALDSKRTTRPRWEEEGPTTKDVPRPRHGTGWNPVLVVHADDPTIRSSPVRSWNDATTVGVTRLWSWSDNLPVYKRIPLLTNIS